MSWGKSDQKIGRSMDEPLLVDFGYNMTLVHEVDEDLYHVEAPLAVTPNWGRRSEAPQAMTMSS